MGIEEATAAVTLRKLRWRIDFGAFFRQFNQPDVPIPDDISVVLETQVSGQLNIQVRGRAGGAGKFDVVVDNLSVVEGS